VSRLHGKIPNAINVIIHIAGSVLVYASLVYAALKGKNLERDKAEKTDAPS